MKYKWKRVDLHLYEYKALENYLNEMAKQGWHIDKIGATCLRFKQENKHCHYIVGFQHELDEDDPLMETKETQKMKEFMEEFDYEHICGYGILQVFAGDAPYESWEDEEALISDVFELSIRYDTTKTWKFLLLILVVLTFILAVSETNVWRALLFSVERCFIVADVLLIVILSYVDDLKIKHFRKLPYLEKSSSVFTAKRSLRLIMQDILLYGFFGCLTIFYSFGMIFWLAAIPLTRYFGRKVKKFRKLIYVLMPVLCFIAFECVDVPLIQKKPAFNYAEKLGVSYERYDKSSSCFGMMESYNNGYPVITHIELYKSPIRDIIRKWIWNKESKQYPDLYYEDDMYHIAVNENEYWEISMWEYDENEKELKNLFMSEK